VRGLLLGCLGTDRRGAAERPGNAIAERVPSLPSALLALGDALRATGGERPHRLRRGGLAGQPPVRHLGMGRTRRDESGQNEHANCDCGHGGTPSPSRVRSEHHWIRYAYGNAASVSPLMVFGLIVATSRKPLTLVPAGPVGVIVTAIVPESPGP